MIAEASPPTVGEWLRRAIDSAIEELRFELLEYEGEAVNCRSRIQNLEKIRAAMVLPTTPENAS